MKSLLPEISVHIGVLFAETFFKQTSDSRPPFEASYVQNVLLPATDALSGRDKYGFWAIADTGMRQSELFGLVPDDIFLDEEIPMISGQQKTTALTTIGTDPCFFCFPFFRLIPF